MRRDYLLKNKWMRLSVLFVVLYLSVAGRAYAQQLTAQAPQQVAVGQQFRLTYTVNSHDVSNFRVGAIPEEAFDVLMGPSTSTQSRISIVNGNTTQTATITYTYILSAKKEGTFTVPAATIHVGGQQVTSNSVKITVSGTVQQQGGGGQASSRQQRREEQQMQQQPSPRDISASDLFITVTASKKHVVEQEPVLLTYKVYTLVSLTQLEGKMPDLQGFHTQEVPLPQQKSFSLEQYNGRNYKTVTWSQYVMFPQMTGRLEIPSLTFNGVVAQQNQYIDPFEAFFNGGSGYTEVKKAITAPGVVIQVDSLPARPAGFSGGVGSFSVRAEIDKTDVTRGDPVTVKVTVSGVGNLKLIREPSVQFPRDFDTYAPTITDHTRLTSNGVEGNVTYEYLAVPRHQGEFDIPPVQFVYFDTQAREYRTSTTEGFHLSVAKGEGDDDVDMAGQEDVRTLARDIRYIKTGDVRQRPTDDFFFGSTTYLAIIAALILLFVTLAVVFRQRAKATGDLVKARAGKANKVATRRLRQAASLMKAGRSGEFFDEALRALWGYVGDKLNIPVEQLSRENISERLAERGVEQQTVTSFIEAIDECEFERYAPGDPQGNMNKVYDKAMTAIEQIESTMKKKASRKAPSLVLLALCVAALSQFLSPSPALALTQTDPDAEAEQPADGDALVRCMNKDDADAVYADGDYSRAANMYMTLLERGVSPELYYNLGNAYYRLGDIPHAILSYERALLLAPSDGDIRFNLQMARQKTVDKIEPESEMFFVTWLRSLVNMASSDGWARVAIIALALAVLLALAWLFGGRLWLRKVGFFGGLLMLVCFVLANVFAMQQRRQLTQRTGAVIMAGAVTVKSTPAQNGTELFVLHAGTRVEITDDSMNDWCEVRLPDGKQGWLESSQLEKI